MNKRILTVLAAGLLVMGLGGGASALLLTPTDAILWGDQTKESAILSYLDLYDFTLFEPDRPDFNKNDLLYKADVAIPPVESGKFSGSYDTAFFNVPNDPEDALIQYRSGPVADPFYLIVKDGNQTPAWYLFDIRGWNGTDDLVLNGFWPEQGAISHVEMYGSSVPTPEPATMLLFGAGLAGLAGIARRKKPGKNE